jgi:hypothetical protein
MILRPLSTLPAALLSLLLLTVPVALADEDSPFDCQATVEGVKFDLRSLAGEHTANQTRILPPSSTVDLLRFDLCADLKKAENVDERDQVRHHIYVPVTLNDYMLVSEWNKGMLDANKPERKRKGPHNICNSINERIVTEPVVQGWSVMWVGCLDCPSFSFSCELLAPKFISIISTGPGYPHPIDSRPTPQVLNITVLCSPGETSDPIFKSYDGSKVTIEWSAPAGCPFQEDKGDGDDDGKHDDKGPEDDKTESTGSGIGWFFLV